MSDKLALFGLFGTLSYLDSPMYTHTQRERVMLGGSLLSPGSANDGKRAGLKIKVSPFLRLGVREFGASP